MQKQLARIFGNTQASEIVVRDDELQQRSVIKSERQESEINIAQDNETSRFHQQQSSAWEDRDVVPIDVMGTVMSDFKV